MHLRTTLAAVGFACLGALPAQEQAQDMATPANDPFWINAGIGGSKLGLAYDVSMNLMHGRYVFALGGWRSSGRQLFTLFGQGPWENFSSCNITASRVLSGADEPVLFTVGGGISMFSITSRTVIPGTGGFLASPELRSKTRRVPGLALLVRFDVPTCSGVGLDIGARADLNAERSMYAMVIGLRMGRINCPGSPLP